MRTSLKSCDSPKSLGASDIGMVLISFHQAALIEVYYLDMAPPADDCRNVDRIQGLTYYVLYSNASTQSAESCEPVVLLFKV